MPEGWIVITHGPVANTSAQKLSGEPSTPLAASGSITLHPDTALRFHSPSSRWCCRKPWAQVHRTSLSRGSSRAPGSSTWSAGPCPSHH